MPRVTFLPDQTTIEVAPGTSILEAAIAAGVYVEHACGGYCACTTCHVVVPSGFETLSEAEDIELDRLDFAENLTLKSRLACQAKVYQDVTVEVPQATTYGGAHLSREERAARGHH